MTPNKKRELEAKLEGMSRISDAYYKAASHLGVHPFIEFCGFMNEYIKLCRSALAKGVDFAESSAHSDKALPLADYEAAYIAEKFDCIFGPTFRAHPECWKVFTTHLEQHT